MALQLEWTSNEGVSLLTFDCVLRISRDYPGEVTDHAIESGASVSDHVILKPAHFSIDAYVSDWPIVVPDTAMDGVTGGSRPFTTATGVTVSPLRFDRAVERSRVVDEMLLALRERREVLTVRTENRTWQNAVISNHHVEEDESTGRGLSLTLDLQVVRIATSQRVQVPVAATSRRTQRQQQRGAQPAQAPAPVDRRGFSLRVIDMLAPGAGQWLRQGRN